MPFCRQWYKHISFYIYWNMAIDLCQIFSPINNKRIWTNENRRDCERYSELNQKIWSLLTSADFPELCRTLLICKAYDIIILNQRTESLWLDGKSKDFVLYERKKSWAKLYWSMEMFTDCLYQVTRKQITMENVSLWIRFLVNLHNKFSVDPLLTSELTQR